MVAILVELCRRIQGVAKTDRPRVALRLSRRLAAPPRSVMNSRRFIVAIIDHLVGTAGKATFFGAGAISPGPRRSLRLRA
jgi:hypothetical protein